jgi:hypothetical protein
VIAAKDVVADAVSGSSRQQDITNAEDKTRFEERERESTGGETRDLGSIRPARGIVTGYGLVRGILDGDPGVR